MPVSYLGVVFPLLLVGIPLLLLCKSRRASLIATAVSISLLALLFLVVYVPGWILTIKANRGDPAAMYELARWTESHDGRIGEFIFFWPISPNVLGGYAWLEKAAALNYPPAVYAVGVRLKHGDHVPRPPAWEGAGGNHFPQPARGQAMIDEALRLGYQPTTSEEYFYWQQYRK